MKARIIILNLLIALVGGIIAVLVYSRIEQIQARNVSNPPRPAVWRAQMPANYDPGNSDFIYAAERTIHGVVHVETIREVERRRMDPFEFFFGPREREGRNQQRQPEEQMGFGSGVIVTGDGYIVTNYHVISGADAVRVTLNDQRQFDASVAGVDPNTDIALLKIEANELPFLDFGSSDELRLGEWVLAVGNPFGLTSSVTAGIISAKERVLGVLREGEMPMESFLQTDAAVNMGNSGGALVNLRGELVGIPTLIISPTATNIGTAFAVPTSIVQRVVNDIIEYGEVRRGILGVTIMEVSPQLARDRNLQVAEGVYIEGTVDGGAADRAGIRRGDVVLEINGAPVNTSGELQREIGRHQPGDQLEILISRNGRTLDLDAELLGLDEHRQLVQQHEETYMGATFRRAPEDLLEQLNLPGGVQVVDLWQGDISESGIQQDFIIVAINRVRVNDPLDVVRLLEALSGNVVFEGVYPDGQVATYTMQL